MKNLLLTLSLFICSNAFAQQASLEIRNNSERTLFVKIMHRDGGLYSKMTIPPYSTDVEYFTNTGYYYLKTKASKKGLRTVFKKGEAFRVYNGSDGYSVLTITFSISGGVSSGGREISESEFNRD
jgi:hypothetical protein